MSTSRGARLRVSSGKAAPLNLLQRCLALLKSMKWSPQTTLRPSSLRCQRRNKWSCKTIFPLHRLPYPLPKIATKTVTKICRSFSSLTLSRWLTATTMITPRSHQSGLSLEPPWVPLPIILFCHLWFSKAQTEFKIILLHKSCKIAWFFLVQFHHVFFGIWYYISSYRDLNNY